MFAFAYFAGAQPAERRKEIVEWLKSEVERDLEASIEECAQRGIPYADKPALAAWRRRLS
jgi:hypothetical protein